MPPTRVTAPTTPRTPTTAASSRGATWRDQTVGRRLERQARAHGNGHGTPRPGRHPDNVRARPRAGDSAARRTVRQATSTQRPAVTTVATTTPMASRAGSTDGPWSGSSSRASPMGKRVEKPRAAAAVMAAVTPTLTMWGATRPDTRPPRLSPSARSAASGSEPARTDARMPDRPAPWRRRLRRRRTATKPPAPCRAIVAPVRRHRRDP